MNLHQHFTPTELSQQLVAGIGVRTPRTVVDIGAGNGSLLLAAQRRWPKARLLAFDIDGGLRRDIQINVPSCHYRSADALAPTWSGRVGVRPGSLDVAVCNPPFAAIPVSAALRALLGRHGLGDSALLRGRLRMEAVFIARNMDLLRDQGELAIIVPDTLMRAGDHSELRSALHAEHGLSRVVEWPGSPFKRTDARTHVLYLKKGGVRRRHIRLESPGAAAIPITPNEFGERGDFRHYQRQGGAAGASASLRERGGEVMRGYFTKAECIQRQEAYFHTTSFKQLRGGLLYARSSSSGAADRALARAGDILIPRVGSRCLHHTAWVRRGSLLYSDCIYRLRLPAEHQQRAFEALRSDYGQRWRIEAARGVCAQFLSKDALLDFVVSPE